MDTQYSNLRNEDKTSVVILQTGMCLENYITIRKVILKQSTLLTILRLLLMWVHAHLKQLITVLITYSSVITFITN